MLTLCEQKEPSDNHQLPWAISAESRETLAVVLSSDATRGTDIGPSRDGPFPESTRVASTYCLKSTVSHHHLLP